MNSRTLTLAILLALCAVLPVLAMPLHPDAEAKLKRDPAAFEQYKQTMRSAHSRGVDAPHQVAWNRDIDEINTTIPILFLLVDFPDQPAQTPASAYDSLFFGMNGSLRRYYQDISYGNLDLTTFNMPSSIGWLRMPHPYSYYVGGDRGTGAYPTNSQGLTEDAVLAADGIVNFSPYATNISTGDSTVTALFIVHSGTGHEITADTSQIHSHAWGLWNDFYADGVRIFRYSTEPEFWNLPGDMTPGVFAHEMGHAVFGCPDLYDTDYSSRGIGNWSLMAGGSWGGGLGNLPAHPDAYNRLVMGFVTASSVTTLLTNQAIPPVERSPVIYKLQRSANSTQYFLVENRQRIGFDTTLIEPGIVIYHVDTNQDNNDSEWYPGYTENGNYKVAIEQADNQYDLERNINKWDRGDPYPGSSDNRDFTPFSSPNSNRYTGTTTLVSVSNIYARNDTMIATMTRSTDTSRHLVLTTPNGGESWSTNTPTTIRWARTNFTGGVHVLLKQTPQSSWDTLFSNITGRDTVVWTPTHQADSARIRIVSSDGLLSDQSNATFAIHSFAMVYPNGGETLGIDSTVAIRWDPTGYTGTVRIDVNRTISDSGWTTIASNVTNSGRYNWLVTGPATTHGRIRVVTSTGTTIQSESEFSIAALVQPSIALIAPNSGEHWDLNSTQTFRWNSVGYTGQVHISIKRSPSSLWTRIYRSLPNTGSATWHVTGPVGDEILFVITSVDSALADISDNYVSIQAAGIALPLTHPNGGESWPVDSTRAIQWSTNGYTGLVSIDINRGYPDSAWTTLASDLSNSGNRSWTVTGPSTTQARMRLRNGTGQTVALSDSNFTIYQTNSPTVTLIAPNGGDIWPVDSNRTVQWSSTGYNGTISIELNRAYPDTLWTTIATNLPNTGSYTWVVTGPATTRARIRLVGQTQVFDMSEANFTILSFIVPRRLTLLAPNGGERWDYNTGQMIRWSSFGYTDSVNLMVRPFPSQPWIDLGLMVSNTGAYQWIVGHYPSDSVRFGIYNRDSALVDSSDEMFSILGDGVTINEGMVPQSFSIDRLHPNPFNSKLTIRYGIPKSSPVSLTIYDVSGRIVLHTALGTQPAGYHGYQWNATHASSGLYLIRLEAEGKSTFAKAALLK